MFGACRGREVEKGSGECRDKQKQQSRGLLRFTLISLVVMCHLQTSPSEAALDVESLVGVAAVENALVTADLFGDIVERLDESEAELLALLVFSDSDVFDVSDGTEAMDAIK